MTDKEKVTDEDGNEKVTDRVQTSARRATKKAQSATKAAAGQARSLDMKGYSPMVVGIVRGVVEAAVLAGIGALIVALGDVDGVVAIYAPIGIALLRSLEGLVDHKIDPSKQRTLLGAPLKRS